MDTRGKPAYDDRNAGCCAGPNAKPVGEFECRLEVPGWDGCWIRRWFALDVFCLWTQRYLVWGRRVDCLSLRANVSQNFQALVSPSKGSPLVLHPFQNA